MSMLVRSLAATLIMMLFLCTFYFLLFPETKIDDPFFAMMLLFVGGPLFILTFSAVVLFSAPRKNKAVDDGDSSSTNDRPLSNLAIAGLGAASAGVFALQMHGIIWQVWLIFVVVGGVLGAVVGVFRR